MNAQRENVVNNPRLFGIRTSFFWSCLIITVNCASDMSSAPSEGSGLTDNNGSDIVSSSSSDNGETNSQLPDVSRTVVDGWQKPELPDGSDTLDLVSAVPDVAVKETVSNLDDSISIRDITPDQSDTVSVNDANADISADTSTDIGEDKDIVDLPPIKGPLCQDQCTVGTKVCADTTTYLYCGNAPEGCKKMLPGKCKSNAQCIDGECYCAPTGETMCAGSVSLYEQTVCGTKGEYLQTCPYPGCYDTDCVSQPPISHITPWPTGSNLTAVAVLKDGYVAVGQDSGIVHAAPAGIVNRSLAEGSYPFGTVLAYAHDNVYAMVNSLLFHFDGNSWASTTTAEAPPIVVEKAGPEMSWMTAGQTALWGLDPSRFYSVGGFGTIYYYEEKKFHWMPNPHLGKQGVIYRSIWGSSLKDIYAVGDGGGAVHYDGKSWKPIPQFDSLTGGLGGTFRSVHGRDQNDVYLIRENEIWHFDGVTWNLFPAPSVAPNSHSRIFASAEGGLYLTGGTAFSYVYHNGTAWTDVVQLDISQHIRAISGNDYGVVMVGDQGLIVEVDGAEHNIVTQHLAQSWPLNYIHDIWGFEDDTVFAVGDFGTVIRKEPDGTITQWITPELLPNYVASPRYNYYGGGIHLTRPWNTIWGSSPSNVYVGGVGIVRQFDGKVWTSIHLPDLYADTLVMAIYGTGPNDIYVSGKRHYKGPDGDGYLAHFDGTTWNLIMGVPSLGCLWGRDPNTWYGAGWNPKALFSIGPNGVIANYSSTSAPDTRCHIAGLPTGEVLVGWGCAGCTISSTKVLQFLDAKGQLFKLTALINSGGGVVEIISTPDHNFALMLDDGDPLMTIDVDLLYDGLTPAAPEDEILVPMNLTKDLVIKPHLRIPGAESASWWSPKGKIYIGGNNNQLFSSP